jgi:hypothetical protein
MALYHLIYQSKATQNFTDADLAILLDKARAFNQQYNVTGILLYGHGSFLQMLEGDDDVIRALYYLRISSDPGHTNLRVLKEGDLDKRLFDRWAMAFRPLDMTLFAETKGYVNPDTESEYGRNLLAPLVNMEAFEMLSLEMKQKENDR